MTDEFMLKCYNNVPIIIDRYPENSRMRALAIDAVRHPNRPRCRSASHNWLSQLTPQNIALQGREHGKEEFEKKLNELTEGYKGTLDALSRCLDVLE